MSPSILTYGDHRAKVEFDERDGIFVGHVLDLQDPVSFEADSRHALMDAFKEAVDDYIDWCNEEGRGPEVV